MIEIFFLFFFFPGSRILIPLKIHSSSRLRGRGKAPCVWGVRVRVERKGNRGSDDRLSEKGGRQQDRLLFISYGRGRGSVFP